MVSSSRRSGGASSAGRVPACFFADCMLLLFVVLLCVCMLLYYISYVRCFALLRCIRFPPCLRLSRASILSGARPELRGARLLDGSRSAVLLGCVFVHLSTCMLSNRTLLYRWSAPFVCCITLL